MVGHHKSNSLHHSSTLTLRGQSDDLADRGIIGAAREEFKPLSKKKHWVIQFTSSTAKKNRSSSYIPSRTLGRTNAFAFWLWSLSFQAAFEAKVVGSLFFLLIWEGRDYLSLPITSSFYFQGIPKEKSRRSAY
ncbi:hypothetical protein QVD17_00081 [Tagetes erecta]|uniref:Uncharacterized protein n=1 Tax=Tagetes erecta TaxID=13708 RepID=A0AAD8P6W7_TARER|nr:hypothetical protein QVD17_00081 [Tagetes erecta]